VPGRTIEEVVQDELASARDEVDQVASEPETLVEPALAPAAELDPDEPPYGVPEPEPAPEPEGLRDADITDAPEVSDGPSELCVHCGARLAASDIFCPECGFVRHRAPTPRPRDTAVLDPFPWGLPPTPRVTEPVQPVALPPQPPVKPPRPVPTFAPPAPTYTPATPGGFDDDTDIEETRIVDRSHGNRFVLQFSTGESVSVSGTGLIGRHPLPEPGEYFDSFVAIIDPGKSVSKTHLEFGQDSGSFWVSDRFSGNGTIVREPERQARRCEPGKRYRVVRGTRVDIGEQFFIVS
jgi:hypothetical protein